MSDQFRLLALSFFASILVIAERARAEIVINEIQYRPGSDYPEVTALEFIELHNRGSADVDLSGWSFTRGISFTFPAGATIPANGYLVVAANPGALQSAYGIGGVAGPWGAASLSNRDETIALTKPAPTADGSELVDEVHYASEGDWAVRVRETTFGGWDWRTPADGGGSSIELRNPALPNDNGQNWAPSSAAAGATPGAVNSTATTDIAPIIAEVRHAPAVPRSNEPVTISCTVLNETAPNVVLFWRNATGLAPGPFQSVAMTGDGAGRFSATLGALPDLSIVEFYVEASDQTATRTWPAPTSEGQNANCQYQVNDEVFDPNEIYYLLVLSGPENNDYENLAASNPGSDRQFNVTLISVAGTDRTIRYRASMRIRGNSSRGYQFKPLRISLPLDDRWNGTSDFNLNPRGSFLQFIGFRMFQQAGVRVEDAIPVRPRRNGITYSSSTGRNADYGRWVRVEELNGDMVDNHWPLQKGGNLYKKGRPDQYWRNTGWTIPDDPEGILDGWSKQNNSGANDWSDLTNFFAVAQQITAPHFPGAPPGNSANANGNPRTTPGAWDGTAFTDSEMTTLASVADLDQWALWFAVMTILQDNETNISNGQDDDYSVYFAPDGNGGRKLHLIPHDLDTVLGLGDSPLDFDAHGLYDMTDEGSVFRPLLPLLGNNAAAGNAAFRAKYHDAIRRLYGSVFNADTSTNPYPAFYAFIDNHLGGWVPAATLDGIKDFATQRQNLLLSLIGSAPIAPPPATSVSTLVDTPGPLMISEVLASNVSVFPSGAGFPDIIELHNASDLEVDIGGMALTDDPALPAKFVFPAGTAIPARGFLLVHADDVAGAGLHTGFGLDHEGDEVRLYSGATLLDAVSFGPQAADLSISRTGPALDVWTLTAPTLGGANGVAVPLGSIGALRINELLTNPDYLLRDDFIELHNPGTLPIALGGVRITDDFINYPSRHILPPLSFLAAQGYRVLYPRGTSASARNPSELPFKFSATTTWAAVIGANGAIIDRLDTSSLPADVSRSRVPDGGAMLASFGLPLTIPTPGSPNVAPPASVLALLNQLRISEVLYRPSELEFVELQNVGSTPLDITGVRFTGGIEYLFGNTVLAPGAFIVVCRDPAAFIARFGNDLPLAPGSFVGTIDNAGETLTLQPPVPWDVNILRFAYSPLWYAETNNDHSLVIRDIAGTRAQQWDEKESWIFSEQQYGNPGRGFPPAITSGLAITTIVGDPFSYAIQATQLPSSYTATGLPAGLSLDGTTGVISGSVAEAGLFNVVISANNAAGMDSETLLLTAALSGPLAGFQWDVTGNQTAGHPFTATLRAVDSAGRTVAAFNGNATIGAQRRTPTATVVITEIGTTTPTPDYFEIQNVGDTAADTAGWFVLTSLSSTGVNFAHPTAWPLPPTLQPAQIAGASDTANLAPTETPYGDNIDWPNNPPASGWVMLVDDAGVVRDFVAWGYTAAEIETIQISHNGFTLNVNGEWNGDGAPVIPADRSLFRGGNADNNNAADWLDGATPSPRGTQNAQLIVPWSVESTPLAIRPAVEIALVNGIWSGSITFLDVSDFAELYAVIDGGSVARSNSFTVDAPTANTPPVFTKGADQLVPVDAGTRSVPLWATDILPGPSSEAGQLVTFIISTDKPEMFFSGPTLQPNGTLTFTPDLKAGGTANVTVRAKDNGGTLNGGVDTSEPQTFTIRLISATLAQGKYQALIEPPPGVNAAPANMGRGEFTVSAAGRFSGKVQVGGKTYPAKGAIAHSGVATFGRNSSALRLPRKGLSALVLDMHADLAGPNRQLVGRLFDGPTLFAEFVAHRDGYDAKLNPLPAPFLNDPKGRGNYVGVFAAQPSPNGGLDAAQFPSGDGWALLRLSSSGALTMRGQTADGSGFAFGSSLSATNEFPLYAPLYRRGGALAGRLRFDTTANMRLGTDGLVWFRPQLRSNIYPQGWPLGIALGFDGSGRDPFRIPNQLPPGAATLTLSGGNLAGVLQKALTVTSEDQISVVAPDPDKTRIKLNATGQWSGSFVHPATGRSTTLRGVILPHREEGRGFFLGSSEAGLVEIRPQP